MSSALTERELFEGALAVPAIERGRWLVANCEDFDRRTFVERLIAADSDVEPNILATSFEKLLERIGDSSGDEFRPAEVGPFKLLEKLGEGGASIVFRAKREQDGVEQMVALKLLRNGIYSLDEQRRFRDERRALAQLQHPGIVQFIEGGITDIGIPYIALELVKGTPITEFARARSLNIESRLSLFTDVCRAVEAAHHALIVHRDLKPSNVLVTDEGMPKLLDFGIAKHLNLEEAEMNSGRASLTPAYAAPEQFSKGPITTATDVYALGILLCELLTGERRKQGERSLPSSNIDAHSDTTVLPVPPQAMRRLLRGDLDSVVLKATHADPANRYLSAAALADDIKRYLEGRPVSAHPPSRWYRAMKFVRRHRGSVVMSTLFLIAIVAALCMALWEARTAYREAALANATKGFLVDVFRSSDPRIAQEKPRGQITAKELLDLNAPKIPERFADDPDTEADMLGTVASIYRELGESAEYLALRKQQIDILRAKYGELHPALIDATLSDIGFATEQNNYAAAQQLLMQADEMIRRAGLDNSVQRALWWLNYREAHLNEPQLRAQRVEALQHAVDLFASIAPTNNYYVTALLLRGNDVVNDKPVEAEQYVARAAEISEKLDSVDDAQRQDIFDALAKAREYQGNYAGAELSFKRALELTKKTYGEESEPAWRVGGEYAVMLCLWGRREDANTLFQKVLAHIPADSMEKNAGAYARELYASCLTDQGRALEAVSILEQTLQVYLTHPDNHLTLPRVRRRLGDAYAKVGRLDDARAIYIDALNTRVKYDAPDYLPFLTLRERVGNLLLEMSDLDGAAAQFEAILENAGDRAIEPVARALAGKAKLALASGNLDAAAQLSSHAVEIASHLTELHNVRAEPYTWLMRSSVLLSAGDKIRAREFAQRALEASQRYDDPSAASIVAAKAAFDAANH